MKNIKILEKKENENNREYAYRLLRYNIMSLQILPGAAINEGELAELLNVSRTPIREAVLMLKDESLIEVYPQSGSKVSLIDVDILKEGFFLRSTIEPEIIVQLAGNIGHEYTERMKRNLQKQEEILELNEQERVDMFFKTDDKFHHIIYEAANKDTIWYAMKRVSSHYDRVRYLDAIMNNRNLNEILREHHKIYYLLLIGFADDYDLRLFYNSHLGSYRQKFQQILERFPEYFKV